MTDAVSAATTPHCARHAGCDGWRLVNRNGLSVIKEVVPPSTSETCHSQASARQFFIYPRGESDPPSARIKCRQPVRESVEIAPGIPHRFTNSGAGAVRFRVISAPSTAEGTICYCAVEAHRRRAPQSHHQARRCPGRILHADRGSKICSRDIAHELRRHDRVGTMGRVGLSLAGYSNRDS
jgi:hypothetical protein